MNSKLKLAKEMFKVKLAKANSGEVKSHKEARPNNAKIHIQKPPRYAGVIFIGIALVAFYLGFNETKLIWECRDWPSVTGTVISADIRKTTEWERKGIKSGSDRTLYIPNVLYNYDVKGHRYKSHRVFFEGAEDYREPENARETVNRYPPGRKVAVFYDPGNPQLAVLEKSIRFSHLLFPATCILFVLLGLWALLGKSKAKSKSTGYRRGGMS